MAMCQAEWFRCPPHSYLYRQQRLVRRTGGESVGVLSSTDLFQQGKDVMKLGSSGQLRWINSMNFKMDHPILIANITRTVRVERHHFSRYGESIGKGGAEGISYGTSPINALTVGHGYIPGWAGIPERSATRPRPERVLVYFGSMC